MKWLQFINYVRQVLLNIIEARNHYDYVLRYVFRAGFLTPPGNHPSLVREGAKWPLRGFPSLALGIQFRGRALRRNTCSNHMSRYSALNMGLGTEFRAPSEVPKDASASFGTSGSRVCTADLWIGRTERKTLFFLVSTAEL